MKLKFFPTKYEAPFNKGKIVVEYVNKYSSKEKAFYGNVVLDNVNDYKKLKGKVNDYSGFYSDNPQDLMDWAESIIEEVEKCLNKNGEG